MRSGQSPTRPLRRGLLALALAGLALLAGCSRDHYSEQLAYPVRTDYVVIPGTWEITPSGFNRPGILPVDAINLPDKERSADVNKLKETVGKKLLDPNTLSAADRADYAKFLAEMFGTPAKPKVGGFDPAALKALDDTLSEDVIVKTLKLDPATLAEGGKHYRNHCLHCHGLEGNGRGPTGPWLNPPPRDYRQGIFKYTSSTQDQNSRKPRRDDIIHVLNFGIEGTSMPSFNILSDEEREQLASYVTHLSIRGEVEYRTMYEQLRLAVESKGAEAGDRPKFVAPIREDLKTPTMKQSMEDNLALSVSRWLGAQKPDASIVPAQYTYGNTDDDFLKSAGRGGKIFLGTGGCIACHQNFGRESNLTYDAWGTIVRGRNVYEGIYRGGRRPVDLYNRIYGGIEGAGMTAYKDLKNLINPQDLGITAEELAQTDPLWDIVNFLRALPYRPLRDKLRGDPYKLNLPD
jgi:mono/diheme cytochrome c family protein